MGREYKSCKGEGVPPHLLLGLDDYLDKLLGLLECGNLVYTYLKCKIPYTNKKISQELDNFKELQGRRTPLKRGDKSARSDHKKTADI